MKRLAMISEHASPIARMGGADCGGQNVYVGHVARQLARRGWKVDVFTRQENPFMPQELEWDEGVRIVHLPAGPVGPIAKEELLPWMDEFSQGLDNYVRRIPYDLIHANFFMSAWAALPVAQRAGVPLAVTFHALGRVRRQHQAEADGFPDVRFEIEERIVQEADCVIAECPQDRDDLVSLYHADCGRIAMVPCGYDPAEMQPVPAARARAALGWPLDEFYVLQLGRMVPRKGVDNVIRALGHLVHDHGIAARLAVVGGESDRQGAPSDELMRLQGVAREANVAQRVDFLGSQTRAALAGYYSAANVFVSTPWYEPFGITPVEAMACGRPVIGSDTGGIRYTVRHGRTGFLVPPRDPVALADRLACLASDDALAHRMGLAGARRAQRLFTWAHVGQRLDQLFSTMRHGQRFSPQQAERSQAAQLM